MDFTSSGPIPEKVTFKVTNGSSKDSHFVKKKTTMKTKVVCDKYVSKKSDSEKDIKGGSKNVVNDVSKKEVQNVYEKDATIVSNTKETSNLDVTVNTSNVYININSGEPILTTLPETSYVTPVDGSISMSNMEQAKTLNVTVNLSNKDSMFLWLSYMNLSFFILFSIDRSRSTDTIEDEVIEFDDLAFGPEEDNIDDNVIMSGKQYKILNSILNTIHHFLDDNIGKSYVTGDD
ncbi:unnamed protein product [Lactuca saligna]|uniref:Uncharacterized protein n=1 Tax=Lactuca saligna TaxID=75948 RepID=A0AA35Y3S1_LACSI|nr:unnamed protein product [Lactuca saligna]